MTDYGPRVKHDPEIDAYYIRVTDKPARNGEVSYTEDLPGARSVNLDFDLDGNLIGVEIL